MDTNSTTQTEVYTRSQWKRAINLSAILGWFVVAIPISVGTSGGSFLQLLGILVWAAVIGLPLAFGASWLIAAPILKGIMRSNISWLRAAIWGGVITFAIALVGIVIGRLRGLIRWLDSKTFTQLGAGDRTQEVDGILTAYGWSIVAQNTAVFVLAGVVIALIIRSVIGPGNKVSR